MRKLVVFLLCCAAQILFGQNASVSKYDSLNQKITDAFSDLDTSKYTYSYLFDRSIDMLDPIVFDGHIHDSNFVNPITYKFVYGALFTSLIPGQPNALDSAHIFTDNWRESRSRDTISLSGLFVRYHRFKDNAIASGLLDTHNNKYQDKYVLSQWQDPYDEVEAFVITPPIGYYYYDTLTVVLKSDLWYTNVPNDVRSLEVDFGDGSGWQSLNYDTPIEVTYSDTGEVEWEFRLTDPSVLHYSHNKFDIKQIPGDPSISRGGNPELCNNLTGNETFIELITAQATFQGSEGPATASVTVRDRDSDGDIDRPLIFIEGFDITTFTNPEDLFGLLTIDNFLRNIDFSGSSELEDLLLPTADYDIIYIDLHNHTDFIQNNSLVVQEVIRQVNLCKVADGEITHENVVWGESMGGLIGRHALASMEDDMVDHDTRLFISYDSPHRGAVVPVSAQFLFRDVDDILIEYAAIDLDFFDLINEPAVQQMVTYYVDDNRDYDDTEFDALQTAFANLGMPTDSRNVSISNGSECGDMQLGLSAGDYLVDLELDASTGLGVSILSSLLTTAILPLVATLGPIFGQEFGLTDATIQLGLLAALPGGNRLSVDLEGRIPIEGQVIQVYYFDIRYTKKLLGLINLDHVIIHSTANSTSTMLPLEAYGGGNFELEQDWLDIAEEILTDFDDAGGEGLFDPLRVSWDIQVVPRICFIPTPSALSIGGTLDDGDYVASYAPVDAGSDFDNHITENNPEGVSLNLEHVRLRERHGDWIADELNESTPTETCADFCDGSISGPYYICEGTDFTITPNIGTITWSVSPGGVVSTSSSGNTITLTPIQDGEITLTAERESADGYCYSEITKTVVTKSSADINIQFSAPDQVVAIATPNWEGADYDWYIDDVYQTTTSTNEYSFDCEDGSFTMGVEIDYNTCTTLEGEQPYTMQCIGSIAVTEETLDQILNNTNKKIYIFNTNGQLVRSYSSNQVRHNALRGLSVGMYFVTVLDESSKKTYKLIVTR